MKNCCALHSLGHYKNWSCKKDGYSAKERHNAFVASKDPCILCGALKSPSAIHCNGCTPNRGHLKGKKLSKEWRKNISRGQREEKGNNWKGDLAGYSALHKWVKKYRGNPLFCEKCNFKGSKVKGVWNVHWANKSGNYLRTKEDWISLCRLCHIKQEKTITKRTIFRGRQLHLISLTKQVN